MKRKQDFLENSPSAKRHRIDLALHQKMEILEYHVNNRSATQQQLATLFTKKFKLNTPIGRSTISNILNKSDHYAAAGCSPTVKRIRMPENEHLERAIVAWRKFSYDCEATSFEEYINAEHEDRTAELLTNTQLIQLTSLHSNVDVQIEDAEDSKERHVISAVLAYDHINELEVFFEQSKNTTGENFDLISKLKSRLFDLKESSKNQSSILDYFSI